ncbi:MAG: ABC transporter permease [Spirochaetes bacterium]|nr:ABC transporter permease [Spirochaetota bacterium]
MSMSVENLSIVAFRALRRNIMRTLLTCLGIFIGVFVVILLTGISSSLRIAVREKIQSLGTNAITMMSVKKPFTEGDLKDIRRFIPEVQYITPMNSWEFPVKYRNKNISRQIIGVSNEYFLMGNWELESGSYFSPEEILTYEKVAIIGHSVKKKLFEYEDPIGKVILINRIPFRIVGTLKEKGMALSGKDFDDFIVGPYSTLAMKLFGTSTFFMINISTYSETQVDMVKDQLMEMLKRKHSLSEEQMQGYRVTSSKEIIKKTEEISNYLAMASIAIAFISLIVGGIGIMNIMLASVSERTHEIGIRMAIGAKNRDILLQFLIEALIISLFGGIAGIAIGLLTYIFYTAISKQPFSLSMISIIVPFIFAALVGVLFGFYPAYKASQLNPIDALRHE